MGGEITQYDKTERVQMKERRERERRRRGKPIKPEEGRMETIKRMEREKGEAK